jgi:ribosome-associated translation inhibitor RaiA
METLFFIICSGFFGYIYQKLEKLEAKIDHLEEEVTILKQASPKRKDDHIDFTLS